METRNVLVLSCYKDHKIVKEPLMLIGNVFLIALSKSGDIEGNIEMRTGQNVIRK